jgi:hypothetical protein
MLARRNRGFQVLHMKKRRGGDLNKIEIPGCCQLLEGVWSVEKQFWVASMAVDPFLSL